METDLFRGWNLKCKRGKEIKLHINALFSGIRDKKTAAGLIRTHFRNTFLWLDVMVKVPLNLFEVDPGVPSHERCRYMPGLILLVALDSIASFFGTEETIELIKKCGGNEERANKLVAKRLSIATRALVQVHVEIASKCVANSENPLIVPNDAIAGHLKLWCNSMIDYICVVAKDPKILAPFDSVRVIGPECCSTADYRYVLANYDKVSLLIQSIYKTAQKHLGVQDDENNQDP